LQLQPLVGFIRNHPQMPLRCKCLCSNEFAKNTHVLSSI